MGVVYQAQHLAMGRQVVIKLINQSLLDHPHALERFRQEVRAAAKLSHPNIVTAHDAEQAGDLHLLVMEFVPGQSLAEVLQKKGPLPVARACHYVRQAALGLQHAHERGMVHRDIKPANLMLTPQCQVKILDFGLAKLASESRASQGLTGSGAYMGTPEYSAPEQARDARAADIRADIYSLGCTLYCLLAGHPPFREETEVATILAHLEKEPVPLPELRPEVPPGLWAVVARLLAKDPAHRYQTPTEVAKALAPFRKPGSTTAPAPRTASPAVASPGSATMAPGDTSRLPCVTPAPTGENPPAGTPAPEGPCLQPSKLITRGPRNRLGCLAAALACALAGLTLGGVLLLGLIFRQNTPEGVLVVEGVPADAEVFVDGRRWTVTVPDDREPIRIEVRKGEHELKVTKGGFETFTHQVTIPAGKSSARIRVRLEPKVAAVRPPEPPAGATSQAGKTSEQPKPAGGASVDPKPPAAGDASTKAEHPRPPVDSAPTADVKAGQKPLALRGHSGRVHSVCWSPDGKRLASGGLDEGTVRVWDTDGGREVLTFRGDTVGVASVCWSPDGQRLASAGVDGTVKVWDVVRGQEVRTLKGHGGAGSESLCWSPDGKRLARGSGDLATRGEVEVWDAASGLRVLDLKGHTGGVGSVRWSPDGTRLASGSAGRDAKTGQNFGEAKVWDSATGRETRTLRHANWVTSVCWSPDGARLASASGDPQDIAAATVRVWDAASGREILALRGHTGVIRSLSWARTAGASPARATTGR